MGLIYIIISIWIRAEPAGQPFSLARTGMASAVHVACMVRVVLCRGHMRFGVLEFATQQASNHHAGIGSHLTGPAWMRSITVMDLHILFPQAAAAHRSTYRSSYQLVKSREFNLLRSSIQAS